MKRVYYDLYSKFGFTWLETICFTYLLNTAYRLRATDILGAFSLCILSANENLKKTRTTYSSPTIRLIWSHPYDAHNLFARIKKTRIASEKSSLDSVVFICIDKIDSNVRWIYYLFFFFDFHLFWYDVKIDKQSSNFCLFIFTTRYIHDIMSKQFLEPIELQICHTYLCA